MGKTIRKDNVRNVNKFRGYYLDDCACSLCKHYAGKRGCKLEQCCCEEEKLDAIKHGRIKRKRGANSWDS